jgi:putative ABC transport system substrate-binding protein
LVAFRQGLNDSGYVVGENVVLEYRWADGRYEQLPRMAAELVQRGVAVIATFSGTPTAEAAKAATSTIPIIFLLGSDPVAAGLVDSMNRPGGNLTGVTNLTIALAQKRLEILYELVPKVSAVAFLVNPANLTADSLVRETETAATALGIQVHAVRAQVDADLDLAFESITRQQLGALVVGGDPFHLSRAAQITALAARYKVPAVYYLREYTVVGGLMSYGAVATESYRQLGTYAGRILKGAKPADLPVQQPTRFEFVINLKTAKALGLTIPPTLLATADEVIE